MALKTGKLRTTKFSAGEQSDATTAAIEAGTDAIAFHSENGIDHSLGRDLVEDRFATGSFTTTAPQAGMYGDDIGTVVNSMLRGKGTLTAPDWSIMMKSLCGSQTQNTDGAVDALSTTTTIIMKTGGDPDIGQLVYFPDSSHIGRVIDVTAGVSFELDPMTALPATPSEDDDFICGTNWPLTSEDHPYFTSWSYFDGPKKLTFIGNKTQSANFTFEPGQIVPAEFTNVALQYAMSYDSQVVTPVIDTATEPLMCLGIEAKMKVRGTATGSPTTTETVLLAPNYDVSIGDVLTANIGAGVYETVSISTVSGNAGGNITLAHDALSVAVSSGDTVYITLSKCSKDKADSLTLTIEAEMESEMCVSASFGRSGREQTGRTITLERSLYFQSWQEFFLRDDVVDYGYMISLGDTSNNIAAFYISAAVNTEVDLEMDTLMKVSATSQATADATLGNEYEFIAATF